jgi:hypothetical protein
MELKDMPYWGEKKSLSKFEAYLDLCDRKNKGHPILISELARDWDWHRNTVKKFIEDSKYRVQLRVQESVQAKRLSRKGLSEMRVQDSVQTNVQQKTITINSKAKKLFMDHFQNVFGEAYYWEAKDAVNMDKLVKKISNSRKERELTIDDDSVLSAFKVFLEMIKDDWVLKNFTVPIINSKYNSLVSQAKESVKKGMDVGMKYDGNTKYDKSKLW